MSEFEEVQGLASQTKLVYNFKKINDISMDEIKGKNIEDLSHDMIEKESLDQQASDEQMKIKRKVGFMVSTLKDLKKDGLISDYSILESSLEQVYKNVVI